MTSDPARDALKWAIADAEDRRSRALGQALRPLAGGCPWYDRRVASARGDLARALVDRAVARALLAELDAVDGENGGPP